MAVAEFKLEQKGMNAAAMKFNGWYVIGLKESSTGKYDVVFSEKLTTRSASNGTISFGPKEFVMSPGDKVDLIAINSTNPTGPGLPLTAFSMIPKSPSLTKGEFPYGGLLVITGTKITVATG